MAGTGAWRSSRRRALSAIVLIAGATIAFLIFTGPPTLSIDSGCRNDISMRHDGDSWLNGGPIPEEWRYRGSVEGTFERRSDTEGVFSADGFDVTLYAGNTTLLVCESWPEPEDSA
ncbi:MAG: hypothetical protein ACI81L_001849 [Verrucomicrobiales bacterium]|jgi:hypothetical protein